MNLTDMNELLSKELENVINLDEQMKNETFNRMEYLKELKEDNKNIINLSLKNLTTHMKNYGNKGHFIKTGYNNINQNNNKNKNIQFSFKKNEEEDNENQYSNEEE